MLTVSRRAHLALALAISSIAVAGCAVEVEPCGTGGPDGGAVDAVDAVGPDGASSDATSCPGPLCEGVCCPAGTTCVGGTCGAPAAMQEPRAGHDAVADPSGRVYVAGGVGLNGATLATAEVFDPATNAWTPLPPMTVARQGHVVALDDLGRLYAIGGATPTGTAAASERFDPALGVWQPIAPLLFDCTAAGAARSGGSIYVAGGSGSCSPGMVQVYDVATDTWTQHPPLLTPRLRLELEVGPDGRLHAVGGSDPTGLPTGAVEIFDPLMGAWIPGPPLGEPRAGHGLGVTNDGRLVAVAGVTASGANGAPALRTETLRPGEPTWVDVAPIPIGLNAPGVASLPDGRIVVTGGVIPGTASGVPTVQIYVPWDDAWVSSP